VTDQAVVNLIFEVGSEAQQVIVTGEASIVNTQNATLGGLVTVENIENLPLNGRNYVDLTLLQPGVNKDRNVADPGTSFSVNGAPRDPTILRWTGPSAESNGSRPGFLCPVPP